MYDLGFEAIAELLIIAAYGIGAVAFTGLGLLAEQTGVNTLLTSGVSMSGLWMMIVGFILVYAGVAYCGRELLATVAHTDS